MMNALRQKPIRIVICALLALLLIGVGVVIYLLLPEKEPQTEPVPSGAPSSQNIDDSDGHALEAPDDAFPHDVPRRVSLSGTYVCAPHKNPNGPQTKECLPGLKTADGSYYVLDLSAMSQIAPRISVGDTISANGLLVPIEQISSDHWQQYNIEGIFSVTDSLIKK